MILNTSIDKLSDVSLLFQVDLLAKAPNPGFALVSPATGLLSIPLIKLPLLLWKYYKGLPLSETPLSVESTRFSPRTFERIKLSRRLRISERKVLDI